MVLKKLSFKNFMGAKEVSRNFNGKNASLYGDNGTGKTTHFTAFLWLLFGKDHYGKKDFEIKPLDEFNNPIHRLESEVEAVIEHDGKEVILKKVLREKWTKKRGSTGKVFEGNENLFWIDEVPSSAGEYKKKIESFIAEDVFMLVTNPLYFNKQLHWKERREIILEVCGDINDKDIISSDKKFAKLAQVLGDKSIDDIKKIIAGKQKKINQELKEIPVRISELNNSLPELTSGIDYVKLTKEIDGIDKDIEKSKILISDIKNGNVSIELKKKKGELELELSTLKQKITNEAYEDYNKNKQAVAILSLEINQIQAAIDSIKSDISDNDGVISQSNIDVPKLRDKWGEKNKEVFESTVTDTCPMCGQPLPKDEVEAAIVKAEMAFEIEKTKILNDISKKGQRLKSEFDKASENSVKLKKQFEAKEKDLKTLEASVAKIEVVEPDIDYTKNAEYTKLQCDIKTIVAKIIETSNNKQSEVDKVNEDIAIKSKTRNDKKEIVLNKENYDKLNTRITDLLDRETELAGQYERLEGQIYLVEQYIVTKVKMLESKINSKFKVARFKMFKEQINGGIEETCITLVKGVPFGRGLNLGGEIGAGLDIINVLSKHYKFNAPIFIDNRESVSKITPMDSQIINMYKVEGQDVLTVKIEGENVNE